MSDLAILSPSDTESDKEVRSFAILSPSQPSSPVSEANFLALVRSMPSSISVISGQASSQLEETGLPRVDQGRRKVSDAHAVFVVCPQLDTLKETAYLARLAVRSRIAGRVFAMVAVAAKPGGNFATRFLRKVAIKNSDLTIVRDESSADALLAAGVEGPLRIGADPAWTELGDLFAARKREDRVVVAVDEAMDSISLDTLSKFIHKMVNEGTNVWLQPWPAVEADQSATGRLLADLGDRVNVLPAPASLREARDVYASSRAVVATRFHSVMAAGASGTPTLVVGDESSADLGDQLGLKATGRVSSAEELHSAFDQVLSNGTVGGSAVPSLIDRARASLDLVHFTLTEGAEAPSTSNEPLPLYPSPWRQ